MHLEHELRRAAEQAEVLQRALGEGRAQHSTLVAKVSSQAEMLQALQVWRCMYVIVQSLMFAQGEERRT